jgi:FkbM family methyltransferase
MNNIIEKIIQILFRLIGVGWGFGTVSSEVKCVKSIIKNGSVFIDCGGNTGNYSNEIIKSFEDPEIHIFEPSSKNITILQKRFSNNNKIKVNGAGLSNKTSESILFSNESGSRLGSLTKRKLDHFGIDFTIEENIKLIQFKDYWNENINSEFIDLFKIDVEGHEMDVLNGIGNGISKIKLIQFEFGGCNIDTRSFFQDFWYFFNNHNFKIFRISPLGLIELKQYKEIYEHFTTTNFLFLNKIF